MSHTKRQYENDYPQIFGAQSPERSHEIDRARNAEWELIWEKIEQEADAMLEAEGVWTVEGRYFADHEDAHMQRMIAAERRVRARIRQAKLDLNSTFVPKELRGIA